MATWKQEVAAETTPISGVNEITATLKWNIEIESDRGWIVPRTTAEFSGSLAVKSLREIDRRLIDGINYVSGDMMTAVAYLNYLEIWQENSATLETSRPLTVNYGIAEGIDTLEINSESWKIVRVQAAGLMDDEDTGAAVPSKLIFHLRK